jgi:3-deoxy-D-manno-octulosonic-acid transferase
MAGVLPIIGPDWRDFAWVGKEIFHQNLVRIGQNAEDAAQLLINDLKQGQNREGVRMQAQNYLKARQGGTRIACQAIVRAFEERENGK